jgi:uncharacterized membrane protein YfcA
VDLTLWQIVVIFVAAFVAGIMNALAGGGTILTFPALIWIGQAPVVANVTSTVALLPGALSSFFGYRKEVSGSRRWIEIFILPSIIGGLLGALLLLLTPAKFFALIVPYLILFATVLFALQEPLNRRLRRSTEVARQFEESDGQKNSVSNKWLIGAVVVQFIVAIYGGYFGAGVGILMLATLGLIGLTDIHQMNGLKNALGFSINSVASISFIFSGQVRWSAALVMAIAAIIGGYSGANLARKLGRTFARRAVIVIGLIMTLSLFIRR